jgi:ATP-dependent DNA helicase 2 subunit 2
MFIVDVSPTMGTKRTLELPPGPNGETRTKEATHLQWSLQFAMLKIQEMVCIVPHSPSLPDWAPA